MAHNASSGYLLAGWLRCVPVSHATTFDLLVHTVQNNNLSLLLSPLPTSLVMGPVHSAVSAKMIPLLSTVLLAVLSLPTTATAQVISPASPDDDTTPNLDVVTAQNSIKILVCGDSITQGADGDFTWRYRLWEWFQQANAQNNSTDITPALRFVGPYNGTLPASVFNAIDLSDPQTAGTYHPTVDPAFYPGGGSNHFAVYGRPAWMDIDLIQAQVSTYQPDFVVLHLGFNDIGWWSQTATELVESVRKLVNNARLGRSDIKVLIADVSHRLLVQGREDIPPTTDRYNTLLKQNVLRWSTVESPVLVAKVSEDYDCEFPSFVHVMFCFRGHENKTILMYSHTRPRRILSRRKRRPPPKRPGRLPNRPCLHQSPARQVSLWHRTTGGAQH